MLPRLTVKIIWIAFLILTLGMTACTPQISTPTLTPSRGGTLTPYMSLTPSRTLFPTGTFIPKPVIPTVTPYPTPTPFIYSIKKGDTLGALALQYNLTIAEIEAANPGIDPNFLTVGITITIPVDAALTTPTVIPTPSPVPISLQSPICYSAADGGAWCLTLAQNEQLIPLESLSAWISLQSPEGETITGQTATSPLDVLQPGAALPLMVFFDPPLPASYTPVSELLTALPAVITDTRYLTVTIAVSSLEINSSALQATVRGNASLSSGGQPARLVWLAVVAYDVVGNVVGMRRWEATGDPLPDPLPFDVNVFSLGPKITRVEVLGEAKP